MLGSHWHLLQRLPCSLTSAQPPFPRIRAALPNKSCCSRVTLWLISTAGSFPPFSFPSGDQTPLGCLALCCRSTAPLWAQFLPSWSLWEPGTTQAAPQLRQQGNLVPIGLAVKQGLVLHFPRAPWNRCSSGKQLSLTDLQAETKSHLVRVWSSSCIQDTACWFYGYTYIF